MYIILLMVAVIVICLSLFSDMPPAAQMYAQNECVLVIFQLLSFKYAS